MRGSEFKIHTHTPENIYTIHTLLVNFLLIYIETPHAHLPTHNNTLLVQTLLDIHTHTS